MAVDPQPLMLGTDRALRGRTVIAPDLIGRELVVHLFAPLDGPDTAAAVDHLMEVWHRCQHDLGMRDEIAGLGLPASPADGWSSLPGGEAGHAAIAACTRSGTGAFQAILRRHHDVVNLSVVLAPPTEEDASWEDLDEQWSQVSDQATRLLGVARIHTGRLRGAADLANAADLTAAAALAVRPALTAGLLVWEVDPEPDSRPERRIVVLGAENDDARLSAWVWSRGTPEIPPFARYLLHAAKIRYHLRVWGDGDAVRELRRNIDTATTALARILDRDPEPTAADKADPREQRSRVQAQLLRLQISQTHLVSTSAALERMRRAVEIARWNMDGSVDTGPEDASDGLFRDDASLITWFLQQLDDDHAFLQTSARRARGITDLARERLQDLAEAVPETTGSGSPGVRLGTTRSKPSEGPRRPGQPGDPPSCRTADISPTWEDRETLQQVLAKLFPGETAAAIMLDRIGFARELRPSFAGGTPQQIWHALVTDMENGRVDAPYRRLIAAAITEFPFNEVLMNLALRYGITDEQV